MLGAGKGYANCSYCIKTLPKTELKKCSKCHLVKYCSKDCQIQAWPTHKHACKSGAVLRQAVEEDPAVEEVVTTLNKWLSRWRGTLFHFGILAMDLANHPHDRLATHVVSIDLERRDTQPVERERLLRMRAGKIVSRTDYAAHLRALDVNEANIRDWEQDNRGDHTLQVNLRFEDHSRTLWISFRDLTRYRTMDKGQSTLLAQGWSGLLMNKIDFGDPGRDFESSGI